MKFVTNTNQYCLKLSPIEKKMPIEAYIDGHFLFENRIN